MKIKLKLSAIIATLTLTACGSPQNLAARKDAQSEKIMCAGAKSENSDGYGGGDGTQTNPYLICTVAQFKTIQGDMGKKRFFRLTTDLDFSTEGNLRIVALSPFASIDGDQHKLKNITIEHGHGFKDNGIFGQLVKDINGNRDEIKNLIIENVKITGDGAEDGGGVIASANWNGVISNVHVTGIVSIEYPATHPNTWSVGGLVGHNSSLIENSSFDGQVTGTYNVGGIAGINEGTIRNSSSSGSIRGHHGVGGLVGVQLQPGTTENNTSSGTISALGHFGDLIGVVCNGPNYSDCPIYH
mgnify:CR=1 FL=1